MLSTSLPPVMAGIYGNPFPTAIDTLAESRAESDRTGIGGSGELPVIAARSADG